MKKIHTATLNLLKGVLFRLEQSYPPPTIDRWGIVESEGRKKTKIEIAKTISFYEAKVAKYGVLLYRHHRQVCIHFYSLGFDCGRLAIFKWTIKPSYAVPPKHQKLKRTRVAKITRHAIDRIVERTGKTALEAIYIVAISIVLEVIRIEQEFLKEMKIVSSGTEDKHIKSIDGGVIVLTLDVPEKSKREDPFDSSFDGELTVKTYVSPGMKMGFNDRLIDTPMRNIRDISEMINLPRIIAEENNLKGEDVETFRELFTEMLKSMGERTAKEEQHYRVPLKTFVAATNKLVNNYQWKKS